MNVNHNHHLKYQQIKWKQNIFFDTYPSDELNLADKMMIDETQAAAESIIINYFNGSDAVIIIDNQLSNNSKSFSDFILFYCLFFFACFFLSVPMDHFFFYFNMISFFFCSLMLSFVRYTSSIVDVILMVIIAFGVQQAAKQNQQ